jgi:competence protein ComEA
VADAVGAAGGAAPDAVLDAVNLAAPLADGQQIYVPHAGETSGPAPPVGASPPAGAAAGPLDLNTATEDELLALPGVGPVLAAAIVRHREEAGPFTSVDGLLDVSGIGPARLESLRELVRV